MKKYERKLSENFNVMEESSKVLELTSDVVANFAMEDICDNIELLEARKQITEKEIEAIMASSGISSLEEVLAKCKKSLEIHLAALTPEDISEEIVFSGLTRLSDKISTEKATVIKPKETVTYTGNSLTSSKLIEFAQAHPEFILFLIEKALPKLTATDIKGCRGVLNAAVSDGFLLRTVTKNIVKSTTKQLSFEDLENINTEE